MKEFLHLVLGLLTLWFIFIFYSYMNTKLVHLLKKHFLWNYGMLEALPVTRTVDQYSTILSMVKHISAYTLTIIAHYNVWYPRSFINVDENCFVKSVNHTNIGFPMWARLWDHYWGEPMAQDGGL